MSIGEIVHIPEQWRVFECSEKAQIAEQLTTTLAQTKVTYIQLFCPILQNLVNILAPNWLICVFHFCIDSGKN